MVSYQEAYNFPARYDNLSLPHLALAERRQRVADMENTGADPIVLAPSPPR
jgi:hypothetical protein